MTRASAFILGYHGCDKAIGEKVLAGAEHLKASDNDYDWLGTGIYFWENSARRAVGWADSVRSNPRSSRAKVEEPFVIGAIIDLGLCLDLLEAESIAVVSTGYEGLLEGAAAAGMAIPANKKTAGELVVRRLDCAVINYVHLLREESGEPAFDTVRAPFIEGPPLYANAGFHAQTHVQICVPHPRQIIGYFRPLAVG